MKTKELLNDIDCALYDIRSGLRAVERASTARECTGVEMGEAVGYITNKLYEDVEGLGKLIEVLTKEVRDAEA